MSYKKIDLATWKRREHYGFFKDFDEPFFGVTFNVKVTDGFTWCKEEGVSFFVYYLYAALKAVNEVEAFRYRIVNDAPVLYDTVSISPTIKRADDTFGFSYMEFREGFTSFKAIAEKEIARVQAGDDLDPSADNAGTIHFSALPWLRFTSLTHARQFKGEDSVPKISVGKVFREGEAWMMPVSVHVNHALADGSHVGAFAANFETFINTKYQL